MASGWVAFTTATAREIQPVGTEVAVPGGHVTVQSVEHALPAELGVPLPPNTHTVAVTIVLAADDGADLVARASDFTIEGSGIEGVVEPSRATPPDVTVPNGGLVAMTLMYAVLDNSTDLALTLPGGERVSAEHDDHPGDAEAAK
jgi:hypothetical protein